MPPIASHLISKRSRSPFNRPEGWYFRWKNKAFASGPTATTLLGVAEDAEMWVVVAMQDVSVTKSIKFKIIGGICAT